MAPDRERPTRRQVKEGRPAQRAAERLAHEADEMERRSEELGDEIDQARSDWRRKKANREVPVGSPPEPEERAPGDALRPPDDQDQDENPDAAKN